MNWIEIITLRSLENIDESLISEFLKSIRNGDKRNSLIAAKIYRNAWINTDVSVHLLWRSIEPEQMGTNTGLTLMQGLGKFGLVNHSAWVEEKRGIAIGKDGSSRTS